MTDEEIKALQEAKDAAERKAAEAEAKAIAAQQEAEKSKTSLNTVVEELKTERQKKNEALEKLTNINQGGPVDVETVVSEHLKRKEQERIASELNAAIEEFKNSKPEFQSDTAGIVFDKFKGALSRFNLSDVTTKEQAKQRLEEVYRFVNFKPNADGSTDYPGGIPGGYSVPEADRPISTEIKSAVAAAGMTEEKFTDFKKKYPEALSGLGIS